MYIDLVKKAIIIGSLITYIFNYVILNIINMYL